MPRFKFFLQKAEQVIVKADNAEEGRTQILDDEQYQWCDYIDEGSELEEDIDILLEGEVVKELIRPKTEETIATHSLSNGNEDQPKNGGKE